MASLRCSSLESWRIGSVTTPQTPKYSCLLYKMIQYLHRTCAYFPYASSHLQMAYITYQALQVLNKQQVYCTVHREQGESLHMPGVGSSSIFHLLAQSTDLEPTGEDCQVHYQPLEPLPTAERVTFSTTFNHSNILIQIKSHSRSQVTDPKWQLLCRLNFNLGNTGTLEISI